MQSSTSRFRIAVCLLALICFTRLGFSHILQNPASRGNEQHRPATDTGDSSRNAAGSGRAPNGDPQYVLNDVEIGQEPQPKSGWSEYGGFIVSLVVAIVGLTGSIYTFVVHPIIVRRLEKRLAYVEAQLKDLYGPLVAECIRTDSIFRKVEQTIAVAFKNTPHHHHSSLHDLRVEDFHRLPKGIDPSTHRPYPRFFAYVIKDIYLPGNEAKATLLKKNVHLYGPHPPMSFFLFLTHAAQLEGLIKMKMKTDLDFTEQLSLSLNPHMVHPFPTILTAEVMAKVALLKALQREYKYRLAHSWPLFSPKKVFKRQQYFLILEGNLRETLNQPAREKLYIPPFSPLLWGPYTAIELIEMRSWLITKERPLRDMLKPLSDSHTFLCAVLNARVAVMTSDKSAPTIPLHYRVSQAFDEIDPIGSKVSAFDWDSNFTWSRLVENAGTYRLPATFKILNWTLAEIRKDDDFAYDPAEFSKLHESYPDE